MTRLARLQRKRSKLIIGLMSGTSVDGIDAVLARVSGFGPSTKLKELSYARLGYPRGFREFIVSNSLPGSGTVDTICGLNILLSHFFADAALKVARKAGVALSRVDLIGSHGQTVQHIPDERALFGKKIRSTLQLGDLSTIAKLTGVPTVGNFRTADMAVGGQGAPLAPYLDFILFRSTLKNRLILNLGGIANVTALPNDSTPGNVIAFDTGPANIIIDGLMNIFYGKEFDVRGRTASRGRILPELLRWMMSHPYFRLHPPKSTGREIFGRLFLQEILKRARRETRRDIIATVTELTSLSVYDQYIRFVRKHSPADEVIVSGGGTRNGAIMKSLRQKFSSSVVRRVEGFGVSPKSKEALLCAVLANETIGEQPANIPSATGASKSVILGSISF